MSIVFCIALVLNIEFTTFNFANYWNLDGDHQSIIAGDILASSNSQPPERNENLEMYQNLSITEPVLQPIQRAERKANDGPKPLLTLKSMLRKCHNLETVRI